MTRRIIRIYKKYTKTRNKRVRLTRCHLQRAGLHCSASIVLNGPLFTLFLFTLFRPRPCRPRPSCHDASRHTRSAATMLGGDDAGAAGGAGGDGDDGRAGGNAGNANGGCEGIGEGDNGGYGERFVQSYTRSGTASAPWAVVARHRLGDALDRTVSVHRSCR